MLPGSSGISKYLEILLSSQFPQSDFMRHDVFLRYLKELGVNLTEEELEFYDKHRIIRPALRFKYELDKDGLLTSRLFSLKNRKMKTCLERIQLPTDEDFQPWKNYEKSKHERIVIYYHPFQFILAHKLTRNHAIILGPRYLEHIEEFNKERLESWKKRTAESLTNSAKQAVDILIPVIGLLMVLEEAYSPFIRGQYSGDSDSLKRWKLWRKRKDMATQILKKIDMRMDKVEEAYGHIADFGYLEDPLAQWYSLLELIKRSKKKKLRQNARLAQEYYELARMIKFFIKELDGKNMPDPDDRWDSNHAYWKPRAYGNPFDYNLPKTQKLILDDYFIERPPLILIGFEGRTEEIVIKKILELFMIDPKKEGYHLYNAEGSGNLDAKKLDGVIKLAKSNEMEVCLIIDNDAEVKSILQQHQAHGDIKDDMITVWRKDFEYDNFGTTAVIEKVNQILQSKGLKTVTIDMVENRMAKGPDVLMKALDNVVGQINNRKKLDDIISKRKLAEDLIAPRILEIEQEYAKNQWKPKLPIEETIEKLFKKYPKRL
jgi:hypothetical protein